MFWRFGGYASISTIDTLLDKPDLSLEELLDETELIQELKQHNTKLIEYLREDNVLKRLMEYVIAPSLVPDDDDDDDDDDDEKKAADGEQAAEKENGDSAAAKQEKKADPLREILDPEDLDRIEKNRLKYAYVACEVLSSEAWSILDSIMLNQDVLRNFWGFLRRPAPLDSLQASYFTKVNETLFDKKTEDMLEFFKSLDGIIPAMLQHVDNPMVMDLLLKIISLEKSEGGQGIVDWLKSRNLMPLLLSFLSPEYPGSVQTSAGDFLKAIITISANATQNDQSCIGPNSLTRQLVSEECVEPLIAAMLKGGNPLTVGVGIVIEVIRKNNSDYDPESIGGPDSVPSTYDPIYLGSLLRIFAKHIPDFMALIRSSKYAVNEGGKMKTVERGQLNAAWGVKIEPLGFDRFKTCELMAELLHCSNMALLNEPGSDDYVRQRNAERERLLYEGMLHGQMRGDVSSLGYHDSTADFTNGSALSSGSRDDLKVLEVTNANEEEGFEDVTSSGVLVDREKDTEGRGVEEQKPEILLTSSSSSTAPPNSQDAENEDQFVDEPLDDVKPTQGTEPGVELFQKQSSEPTSPTTSGLTDQFGNIQLESDEKVLTDESTDIPQAAQTPSTVNKPEQSDSPAEVGSPSSQTEQVPESLLAEEPQSEPELDGTEQKSDEETGLDAPSMASTDRIDLEDPASQFIQVDIDGQAVVGDYLKVMFVENQVVPTILEFFFRFPWNNFLHNVVYDVIQQVFNGPMDRGYNRMLAVDVFETGRIIEQVIEGQRRSDETQKTKHMRLGYMGHLTLIAEEVVKFTERHPPELLSPTVLNNVLNPDWIEYVERTLSETRERDNAILGGVRPDVSIGHRQAMLNSGGQSLGNSSALADAGLNGGIGANSNFQGFDTINQGSVSGGAFGLSGNNNSLLSGFGSSSDDEDEEMDEQEERIATELSAEVDLENSSSNSISQPIPILPPPPAPLSMGPSRARRQLAARLALQKQQATDNFEGEDDSNGQTDERDSHDSASPSNPFVIAGLDDDANGAESPSTAAFPSTEFLPGNREDHFSPTFHESGFSPPDSLSTNSSEEGGEGRAGSTRRKVRIPLEVDDDDDDDDDDEMGEMVGPSMSVVSGLMDSDEEDEAIINESLGYSNLFGVGRYKGGGISQSMGSQFNDEDQNDSSDGEDEGLVEILVPGRKSSASH
ncbi:hypothetical protein ASPZODRAFT_13789 [Penicilliopsis zonata CBS 506.65]|uniref:Extragenic suppressor of kinetochore protein 1 n=1 Tax=Penicilliopsis zonata CBS 506.65 TaxID=1073090 RepID=A0A1L9SP74_9EURO|nr:hypothetical protein ASPZODRAFT_13789 [Penicilliopsis zonata CBS 506.65]OJJ49052.1 hypothetical protein ASPZODRAFT_13789 [Penicilliopsis zonata CBS 506.65]